MLYPYHLSDLMVCGLRVTPFAYYHNMMKDIMSQEKSYDSLPNFTAADCKLDYIICWTLIYDLMKAFYKILVLVALLKFLALLKMDCIFGRFKAARDWAKSVH